MINLSIPQITRQVKWGDCLYLNRNAIGKSLKILVECHRLFYDLLNHREYRLDFYNQNYFVFEVDNDEDIFVHTYDNFYYARSFCNKLDNPSFVFCRSDITK